MAYGCQHTINMSKLQPSSLRRFRLAQRAYGPLEHQSILGVVIPWHTVRKEVEHHMYHSD
eukprot:761882-Hanusia_phi.AAC.2